MEKQRKWSAVDFAIHEAWFNYVYSHKDPGYKKVSEFHFPCTQGPGETLVTLANGITLAYSDARLNEQTDPWVTRYMQPVTISIPDVGSKRIYLEVKHYCRIENCCQKKRF